MNNGYYKASIVLTCFLIIYAVFLIYISRYHFLDDAFIHLRIAENAFNGYGLTFNKNTDSFATSSLLYSFILMSLLTIADGPFLTKYISVFAYFGLLLPLFLLLKQQKQFLGWILTLIFLSAIVSPIGVRWLTDGMETVLVANGAMFLGFCTSNIVNKDNLPKTYTLITLSFSLFILSLLRLEFIYISIMISLSIYLKSLSITKSYFQRIKSLIFILLSCFISLAFVYLIFGQILPDTASAKSSTLTLVRALENIKYFLSIGVAHISSGYFGIALLSCLIGSSIFLLKSKKYKFYIFINISFFIFLFILMYFRQQEIQGIRYFVFIEFYIIAFNLWSISSDQTLKIRLQINVKKMITIGAVIFVFSANVFDYKKFQHIVNGRSASIQKFLLSDLNNLENSFGVAYDIGMIGYFTSATILDPNGLIHGKALAKMSRDDRLAWICNQNVQAFRFVFLNSGQQQEMSKCLDMVNWEKYGEFSFPNYGGELDTHILFVRPM